MVWSSGRGVCGFGLEMVSMRVGLREEVDVLCFTLSCGRMRGRGIVRLGANGDGDGLQTVASPDEHVVDNSEVGEWNGEVARRRM